MNVTKITATLRYSAEAKGAWRTIELGAEATLPDRDESWEHAQAELYHQLGQQLKVLWNNGKHAQEGPVVDAHPSQEPTPPPAAPKEHYCKEHQTEFKRHEKADKVWYSHRQEEGWCNEPRN